MTSHSLTVTAFFVLALIAVVIELVARREGSRIPTLAEVFTRLMATPVGRAAAFAGWLWTGYHFFAR